MQHARAPSDLMVKKLRYYARFIVVCLLLKKMKLVRDLVRELAKQIGVFCTVDLLYINSLHCSVLQTSTQLHTSRRTSWNGASCWGRSSHS